MIAAGARRGGTLRALGAGIVTGAADDDPSAIGTYAAAGARLGPAILWAAPVALPLMIAVVYLSAKLGRVTGEGLFAVIERHAPRWVLWPALGLSLAGNTMSAAADIGGMAAAIRVLAPLPFVPMVVGVTAAILALQIWGSYPLIRRVFQWLALTLLAYVGAALLSRPDWSAVISGTLLPRLPPDRESLSLLVAVIGTALSAYLYSWQSNQEVEDQIAAGRGTLEERRGASRGELRRALRENATGMVFASLVMYCIMLSTASALHRDGPRRLDSAADAAAALRPVAGDLAGALFAAGVVGVGFLAVPVLTTGAAYNLAQAMRWRHGLGRRPRRARGFYLTIAAITLAAMALNFTGWNPMEALVWAGMLQGFSIPPMLLVMLVLTNDRRVMGTHVNSLTLNLIGGVTLLATAGAVIALVGSALPR